MLLIPSVRIVIFTIIIGTVASACGAVRSENAPTPSVSVGTPATDTPVPIRDSTGTATTVPTTEVTPIPSATTTLALADPCDPDQGSSHIGALRVSAERPDTSGAQLATSYVGYGGLEELVWSSHWIVLAELVEICPEPDEFGSMDYVVSVERTFRGTTQETLVVSGLVDPFGGESDLQPGTSMMLFLSPPEQFEGKERIWTLGGPQGNFPIVDGLVTNAIGPINLTVEDFSLAISAALEGNPPDNMPSPVVSLEDAPRRPDLPSSGSPLPSGCGGAVTSVISYGQNMAVTAWDSNQVFIGEVIEQLPAQRAESSYAFIQPVVTDYLLRIDTPVRGVPTSEIRVREIGGNIEGCTLSQGDAPLLNIGDRAVFFALTTEPGSADPTYYVYGGRGGVWRLSEDESFVTRAGDEHYPSAAVPAAQFLQGLVAALNGPPPDPHEYGIADGFVPLDEAPVASADAFPPTSIESADGWLTHEHATDNYSFSYPSDWTLFVPDQPGIPISLANYPTEGGDWESISEGGLKMQIGLPGQPADSYEIPYRVGAEGYPGSIYFSGLFGDTYHVSVAYEADGEYRQIAGYFKEPADLANPNLQTFFAILASIQHSP
ncbi:hypothetical protein BH24CHL1_BH24CHL1_11270 [soil metagenome]